MSSAGSSPEPAVSTRPVVFIGAGGHAAVCLDIFLGSGREVLGYIAPEASKLAARHLGTDQSMGALLTPDVEAFVAIGDNRVRLRLVRELTEIGVSNASCVSAHAVVSPSVRIGRGSVVMPGAVINARTTLGDGAIVNTSASVDHDGRIGDGVFIGPGSHLAGTVTVGEGAFLGAGTIVIPDRSIAAWIVVGAGGVVVDDLLEPGTYVGVPARRREPR